MEPIRDPHDTGSDSKFWNWSRVRLCILVFNLALLFAIALVTILGHPHLSTMP